ncbi:MAG: hypothetical protein ACLP0J_03340 [Solirubrobacteraceae bacterium]
MRIIIIQHTARHHQQLLQRGRQDRTMHALPRGVPNFPDPTAAIAGQVCAHVGANIPGVP